MWKIPRIAWKFALLGLNDPSEKQGGRYATTNVNFYEIMVFCNKMSELLELTPVYSIKGSTDTSSWGEIPTSINADWDKYKYNKKANGFKLSEISIRSDADIYIDEVDRTGLVKELGIHRSPTEQEVIMQKTISIVTSQDILKKIGNDEKSKKYSFRIIRNK